MPKSPKPCPSGSERNPDTGRCRKIKITKSRVSRSRKSPKKSVRKSRSARSRKSSSAKRLSRTNFVITCHAYDNNRRYNT